MIERPPKIDTKLFNKILLGKSSTEAELVVEKINEEYDYWDKVKYKPLPEGYTPTMLWTHVKAHRLKRRIIAKAVRYFANVLLNIFTPFTVFELFYAIIHSFYE